MNHASRASTFSAPIALLLVGLTLAPAVATPAHDLLFTTTLAHTASIIT